uniref:Uncharacterized protein n=1 Tax=Picea glauca TaxID=3330 RepID=A0A101LXZ3_PICGL|nr:hypothetical protein ABT39_MTgene5579 [Picea glauca]
MVLTPTYYLRDWLMVLTPTYDFRYYWDKRKSRNRFSHFTKL